MGIIANLIVKETVNNQKEYKCKSILLPLKTLSQGMSLSMTIGKQALHVYN